MSEIKKTDFVSKCVIFDKEKKKILILKRSNYKPHLKNLWDFPGGGVEYGEDIYDAIKREAIEEVKVELKETPVIKINSGIGLEDQQYIYVVFYCDNFNLLENEIILSNEHSEYKWINSSELKDFDLMYGIKISLKEIEEYLK